MVPAAEKCLSEIEIGTLEQAPTDQILRSNVHDGCFPSSVRVDFAHSDFSSESPHCDRLLTVV